MGKTRTVKAQQLLAIVTTILLLISLTALNISAEEIDGITSESVSGEEGNEQTSLPEEPESDSALEEEPGPEDGEDAEEPEGDDAEQNPQIQAMMAGAPHLVANMMGLQDAMDAILLEGEGHIVLTGDVAIDDTIEVPLGVSLTVSGATGAEVLSISHNNRNVRHFRVFGSLTLYDVTLYGGNANTGDANGGIQVDGDQGEGNLTLLQGAVVVNCYFEGRVSVEDVYERGGGGVQVVRGANMVLDGGVIRSNRAETDGGIISGQSGGGLYVSDGSTVTMHSGAIYGNQVGVLSGTNLSGGGVALAGSTFVMYGGEIYGNYAYSGGGVAVMSSSNNVFELRGGSVYSNTAGLGGGVYVNSGSQLQLYDGAEIRGNRGYFQGGGAYTINGGTINMYGGRIVYNVVSGTTSQPTSASFGGGGIYHLGNSGELNIYGGEIAYNTSVCYGGAIFVVWTPSIVNISDARIFGNSAEWDGGGIYSSGISQIAAMQIHNTEFYGNYAGNGGRYFGYPTDTAYYNLHENNIDVTSLSFPFNHTLADNTLLNKAFNNLDISYGGGSALVYHAVEFYIDGGLWFTGSVLDTVPALSAIEDPTYMYLPLAGESLDGWYTDENQVGEEAYRWDFTEGVGAPMRLYAKTALAHSLTVEYYTGADLASATPAGSEVYTAFEGDNPADVLPAGWLNAQKPAAGYQDGVLAEGTLPPAMSGPMTLKVLYRPLGSVANDVTFYRNHSDTDDAVLHTEAGVTEGNAVPEPADPTRVGHTFVEWTVDRAADSDAWDFGADTMPATALKLYAQWQINHYTLSFDYSQVLAPPNSTATQRVAYNDLAKAVNTQVPGYSFVGWRYGGGYWDFGTDRMPAGDITLVGVWTREETSPGTSEPPPVIPSTTPSEGSTGPDGDGGGGTNPPLNVSSSPASTASRPLVSSALPATSAGAASQASDSAAPPALVSGPTEVSSWPDDDQDSRDIEGTDLPLNWWQRGDGWGLLNLLVSVLLLLSAGFQLVRMALARTRQEDEYAGESVRKKRGLWTVLAAISGGLPIILLFILEDFAGVMLMLDKWTPWFFGLAVLHAAATVVAVTRKERWRQAE